MVIVKGILVMNPDTLNHIRSFVTQIIGISDEQLNAWVKTSKKVSY